MKKFKPKGSLLLSPSNNNLQFGPEITRRGFLVTGASLATAAALPTSVLAVGAGDYGSANEVSSENGLLDIRLGLKFDRNRIPSNRTIIRTRNGKTTYRIARGPTTRVTTRTYVLLKGKQQRWSYQGGKIPGPTLRVRQGDKLRIEFFNQLPPESPETALPPGGDPNIPHGFNTTNIHTHGLNVSPRCDDDQNPTLCSDNTEAKIGPGESLQYEFNIPDDHADGTFWYHPHKHGSTAAHMMEGLQGALIIEGPTDDFLREQYGEIKDKVFLLQQIRVNEDGRVPTIKSFADLIIRPIYAVNGQVNPVFMMRPGEVQRWRFIHGGMSEHFPLELLDVNGEPQPLYQIACDGITLPYPQEVTSIFMASGNRVDVLVKAPMKSGVYELRKPFLPQGFVPEPPEVPFFATILVRGREKDMLSPADLPTPFPTPLEDLVDNSTTPPDRVLTFFTDFSPIIVDPGPPPIADPTLGFPRFPIAGRYELDENDNVVPMTIELPDGSMIPSEVPLLFDPNRVHQVIRQGATEKWTVVNFSPVDHPFHIHQVPFFVTEVFDPKPNGSGITNLNKWQDVQNIPGGDFSQNPPVPGSITFLIHFGGGNPELGGIAGRFVLHCHILDHEDLGMMQLVEVLE